MKIVAGAVIKPGECGEDDVTAENLEQMAATVAKGPISDADRVELADLLRWLARLVRTLENESRSE